MRKAILLAASRFYSYCEEESSGLWTCECSGLEESFEIETEEGWDACTEATAVCEENLDVEDILTGGEGGYYYPWYYDEW